jgi:transcriptional regulator with XRE-family HTH domain
VLAGAKNSAQISRYEKFLRLPSLRTAFALQVIFKIPLADLFAGVQETVNLETTGRIERLKNKLDANVESGKQQRFVARKRSWLSGYGSSTTI